MDDPNAPPPSYESVMGIQTKSATQTNQFYCVAPAVPSPPPPPPPPQQQQQQQTRVLRHQAQQIREIKTCGCVTAILFGLGLAYLVMIKVAPMCKVRQDTGHYGYSGIR